MEFLRSFLRRHFAGKLLSDGVAKCRLFSQVMLVGAPLTEYRICYFLLQAEEF